MKRILFSILAIGLAISLVGGAFAYFTDTATSTTNTLTAGTLSIDNSELTTATNFTIPNIAPGEVTPYYTIIIRNNGNMNLGWLGDWQFAGSPALRNALYIDSAKMEFLTPTLNNWLNDATPGYEVGPPLADHFITAGVGTGPYPDWYNSLAALSGFGVVTFNNWDNNAGMVPGSAYEQVGALKPGYSYRLTFRFGMAAGAGNDYQGLGPVTVNLQVNATQINSAAIQLQGVGAAQADWLANNFMPAQIADQIEP